jgi:DNA-binding MarR family transcriptional regulator
MELAAETARLRAMTNKVLEALEEAGLVKLTRDEAGRPRE